MLEMVIQSSPKRDVSIDGDSLISWRSHKGRGYSFTPELYWFGVFVHVGGSKFKRQEITARIHRRYVTFTLTNETDNHADCEK